MSTDELADIIYHAFARRAVSRRLATAAVVLGCLSAGSASNAEVHTWTSQDGQFSIQAEFIRLDTSDAGRSVLLRKQDGSSVTVPISKLSHSSQELAARLSRAVQPGTSSAAKPIAGGIDEYHAWRNPKSQTLVLRGKLVGWDFGYQLIVLETPKGDWQLVAEADLSKAHRDRLSQLKIEGQGVGLIPADEYLQQNALLKEKFDTRNQEIRQALAERLEGYLADQTPGSRTYFESVKVSNVGAILVSQINKYKFGPIDPKTLVSGSNVDTFLEGDLGAQTFLIGNRIIECRDLWKEIPKHGELRAWCEFRKIIFPKYPPWQIGEAPSSERLSQIAFALMAEATGKQTEDGKAVIASIGISPEQGRVIGSALIHSAIASFRSPKDPVCWRNRARLVLAVIRENSESQAAGVAAEQGALESIAKRLLD